MVEQPEQEVEDSGDRVVVQSPASDDVPDCEDDTGDGVPPEDEGHQFEEFPKEGLGDLVLPLLVDQFLVLHELFPVDRLVGVQLSGGFFELFLGFLEILSFFRVGAFEFVEDEG